MTVRSLCGFLMRRAPFCHVHLVHRRLTAGLQSCHNTHLQFVRNISSTLPVTDPPAAQVLHRKILGSRAFILNRPEKLNAVNLSMIRNMTPQLKAWDVSKLSKVIIIKGADAGRFCAGDDITDILAKAQAKDSDALHFFQEKFRLVQMIATLQTPYIAILDGYALGAALGLFGHGPFRIATERTIFSIPEASIGLFLTSGSSFFLPRLDGEIGTYLALTGSRLEGVDTFYTGIATHYIPSARLGALEERLIDLETCDHDIIHRVLEDFVEPLITDRVGFPQSTRTMIDRCFRYDTIEEILDALNQEKQTAWTRETRQRILSMSPTSLRVTLKTLRKGRSMSLCECLKMEFDLIQKFLVTKDFCEGVDATLVCKPRRKPQWEPSSLADLTDDDIDQLYFSGPSPNALELQSSLDMHQYPHSRFGLPSENDVHRALIRDKSLKTSKQVLDWFAQGYQKRRGVKEKVTDILERKTAETENGLVWQD